MLYIGIVRMVLRHRTELVSYCALLSINVDETDAFCLQYRHDLSV